MESVPSPSKKRGMHIDPELAYKKGERLNTLTKLVELALTASAEDLGPPLIVNAKSA